jgi:hypothetical protein
VAGAGRQAWTPWGISLNKKRSMGEGKRVPSFKKEQKKRNEGFLNRKKVQHQEIKTR